MLFVELVMGLNLEPPYPISQPCPKCDKSRYHSLMRVESHRGQDSKQSTYEELQQSSW